MTPILIGLAGSIGSGKDSIADILLSDHGFARTSFASPLKDVTATVFGLDRFMLEGLTPHARAWRDTCNKRIGRTPRELLQGVGAAMRELHRDVWVEQWERAVRESDHPVVVTDVRYINEAEAIRAQGGVLWRVERGAPPEWVKWLHEMRVPGRTEPERTHFYSVHRSEWELLCTDASGLIDKRIANDGSLDDLRRAIANLMRHADDRRTS